MHHGAKVHPLYLDVDAPDLEKNLAEADGILVPGGFGDRGIEGKIRVARYAREKSVPYFGICLGMQIASIEVARNLAGLSGANSTEFNPSTPHPVIDILPDQKAVETKGATMRLGSYPCAIKPACLARQAYGADTIEERHRHRYELNPKYQKQLEEAGLSVTGTFAAKGLAEIVELSGHPWYLAVQFHPEFQSRPGKPHPLFRDFVGAAVAHAGAKEHAQARH
jgi:CTP synthase